MAGLPAEEQTKLIKILNLSTSNFDGEALNAIRAANAMLKKAGITWNQVLGQQPIVAVKQSPPNPPPRPQWESHWEMIRRMLNACLDALDASSSSYEFIDSLDSQFRDRGYLSEKQYEALKKFYYNLNRYSF